MYEGCFIHNKLLKTFNMSVDQKTRQSIFSKTYGRAFERFNQVFGTLGRAFEGLREKKKLDGEFKMLGRCSVKGSALAQA